MQFSKLANEFLIFRFGNCAAQLSVCPPPDSSSHQSPRLLEILCRRRIPASFIVLNTTSHHQHRINICVCFLLLLCDPDCLAAGSFIHIDIIIACRTIIFRTHNNSSCPRTWCRPTSRPSTAAACSSACRRPPAARGATCHQSEGWVGGGRPMRAHLSQVEGKADPSLQAQAPSEAES